jgi:hypothetical protein
VWSQAPPTDSSQLFSSIEEGLTVELIATFEPRVCGVGDDLHTTVEREDLRDFDYVPVKDRDRTVGLLHRTKKEVSGTEAVGDVMEPLHGEMLISSGSGILTYIERASKHQCHLVLHEGKLNGIVTLSDLQKLPVRPALFLLVTHVELLMVQWIRGLDLSDEKVMSRLPPERQRKVQQEWNRIRKNNMAVDQLTATQFHDKRDLVLEWDLVSEKQQKANARKDLNDIEQLLRNPLAHAGDFALDEENALQMVRIVSTSRRWIERLEQAIQEQDTVDRTHEE